MSKPLQGFGIAITRPVDQAKALNKLIVAAGGKPISYPLIEITGLDDYSRFHAVISQLSFCDWMVFISSNAVQHGMPRILQQGIPTTLKFAAIGPTTAQALKQFGIEQVLIPEGRFDSESLLSLPEMHAMQGKTVMIVRGVGGREVLAETLKSRGAHVLFAECYQRINPQHSDALLAEAFARNALHAVVVTSSEAMRHLLDLANQSPWLKHVTVCVNHARIAEEPAALGLHVRVADAPGDAAMLQTLLKIHSTDSA